MPELKFISIADQIAEREWKKNFEQVAKFKKKTGMLPQRRDDHTLHYWLIMQRKKAKNGTLTEEQLKRYQEAGINILGRAAKTSLN